MQVPPTRLMHMPLPFCGSQAQSKPEHGPSQRPQLASSMVVSVQRPLQQAGAMPCVQLVPQRPQLLGSARRSTHLPPQQLSFAAQLRPHMPQLARSVCRLRHAPSQHVVPAWQAFSALHAQPFAVFALRAPQLPEQHAWFALHWVPHAPQFARSRCRSKPSSTLASQSSSQLLQVSGLVSFDATQASSLLPVTHSLRPPPHIFESRGSVHDSPRPRILLRTPSQSSSELSLSQLSARGNTLPVHGPSLPPVQVRRPARQRPTPRVAGGPS